MAHSSISPARLNTKRVGSGSGMIRDSCDVTASTSRWVESVELTPADLALSDEPYKQTGHVHTDKWGKQLN
jgi:hypothetical protein